MSAVAGGQSRHRCQLRWLQILDPRQDDRLKAAGLSPYPLTSPAADRSRHRSCWVSLIRWRTSRRAEGCAPVACRRRVSLVWCAAYVLTMRPVCVTLRTATQRRGAAMTPRRLVATVANLSNGLIRHRRGRFGRVRGRGISQLRIGVAGRPGVTYDRPMKLPRGYRVRAPLLEDGEAIVRMWNEESLALATTTLERITSPWRLAGAALSATSASSSPTIDEIAGYFPPRL